MTYYCQACGMMLPTRRDADYHRTECHAFVDQVREEIAAERRHLTAEADEPPEQSSQDEHP